ncbi:MAG: type II CRISPR RNA-guided endonuclease Cas9, partial [Bacteroidales bacterium]|nr:type II CRISPR RNA-guided endonuclease Cas9 [Bacteroidales bacterium]
ELNIREKLKDNEVLKLLVDRPKDFELNYKDVEGNRTNATLYKAYQKIIELEGEDYDFSKMKSDNINDIVSTKFLELGINTDIFSFDVNINGNKFDKQAIMQLWHLLYSFEGDNSKSGNEKLLEKLDSKFGFKNEYAKIIANISLQDDHGSLCNRAIRKIIPYLKEGNTYDLACKDAGYNHSSSLTKEELANRELKDKLELLPKNSLRNPIVEKILNQMVNVINAIIKDENLGKPDEIRIELARDLKKSAKEREETTRGINTAKTEHEKIRNILQADFGITKVTRNDIIRYKLWQELESNGHKTLYTNTYIPKEELFSKKFDIEHIIPQAKLFDDSFSNKTLSARQINIDKSNETAYDFLRDKLSEDEFEQYLARIEKLYKEGKIKKSKYNKLLMKSSEIPDGFIERDLRNSQYIAKKAKQMLEEVVRTVNTTTGSITSRLRSDWQLVNVMKELNLPKYEKLGLVETIQGKNGQTEKRIKDWTKRNDHRHHAMDALTVAFTSYSHVQYLNNMNARNNKTHKKYHQVYGIEQKYLHRDKNNKLLFNAPIPVNELRDEAKKHLDSILISFKAKNKVVTRNKNKIKIKGKDTYKEKIELTPRGQLHKETVYGKIQQYVSKEEKIGIKFNLEKIKQVAKQSYSEALLMRLAEFDGDPKKAFGGKNAPSKSPIYIDDAKTIKVPEKIKLVWKEDNYTIRKDISHDLKLDKVIDIGIRKILQNRLDEFNGVSKKAFSNLDENPIWLNKEKGISIKRVTISGVSNAEALHYKKDHNGNFILDESGKKQAVDFVSTANNHHVAIYRDEKGNLQEEVVSFFEAVERSKQGLPIINKNKNDWEFFFTMKQNEYFVFPSVDFNPNEIDLLNPENTGLISPNLYRVQKIATKDYFFRHHLETTVEDKKELKGHSFKRLGLYGIEGIIKVRINHLGQIVRVGEY